MVVKAIYECLLHYQLLTDCVSNDINIKIAGPIAVRYHYIAVNCILIEQTNLYTTASKQPQVFGGIGYQDSITLLDVMESWFSNYFSGLGFLH